MGIYTYPTGIVDSLQVKGSAVFDVSTYITGELHCATAILLDGSCNIGNASGDQVGLYGDAGGAQANTIADADSATDTSANVAIVQAIKDQLETLGIIPA